MSGRGYRFVLDPDVSEDPPAVSARDVAGPEALHRLPVPSTLLIGRESLTESICALARRDDVRLVTLTGPGGSGKTRVALHVTGELAHDFADGSYIVMLAPVRDSAFVASAIAAVLNLQEAGTVRQKIWSSIPPCRETLLTLDNFEHLL